ncbi:hypothetical protein L7F22_047754 [Adiantum nelumboides]|nr:hypothetical protein [Adiantum nelumboides]
MSHTIQLFIHMLIVGSLAGLILFSYKVGVEGKDAMVGLKAHIQMSNYTKRAGLKHWIEESKVFDVIETYAGKAYESILEQIDGIAAQYNATDPVNIVGKQYFMKHAKWQEGDDNNYHVGPSPLLVENFRQSR